jgi:leucyl aminopeptidase
VLCHRLPEAVRAAAASLLAVDRSAGGAGSASVAVCAEAPGQRLVFAPTGPLDRDYDDVRLFSEAAGRGVKRAVAAGASRIVLVVLPDVFDHAIEATVLGALAAAYVPIEVREHRGSAAAPSAGTSIAALSVFAVGFAPAQLGPLLRWCEAVEAGRVVARDVGGSDPERMAAPRCVEYLSTVFSGPASKVQMRVESHLPDLAQKYPLLVAVARASYPVPRHHPRVVEFEYVGEGEVKSTLFLVGKGVTYDTGVLE